MNKQAPEGKVWMCGVCGRLSEWLYGFDDNSKDCKQSEGWDESCVLNCALITDAEAKKYSSYAKEYYE